VIGEIFCCGEMVKFYVLIFFCGQILCDAIRFKPTSYAFLLRFIEIESFEEIIFKINIRQAR
jgi:hypothetical protein